MKTGTGTGARAVVDAFVVVVVVATACVTMKTGTGTGACVVVGVFAVELVSKSSVSFIVMNTLDSLGLHKHRQLLVAPSTTLKPKLRKELRHRGVIFLDFHGTLAGWGGINCPKIKIDWYFFVEIETNKKIRLKSQGCVK